jgi:hypothetical protein
MMSDFEKEITPYLQHKKGCMSERGFGDGPCNCGLWEIINKYDRIIKYENNCEN